MLAQAAEITVGVQKQRLSDRFIREDLDFRELLEESRVTGVKVSDDYRFGQILTLPNAGTMAKAGFAFGGWMPTATSSIWVLVVVVFAGAALAKVFPLKLMVGFCEDTEMAGAPGPNAEAMARLIAAKTAAVSFLE